MHGPAQLCTALHTRGARFPSEFSGLRFGTRRAQGDCMVLLLATLLAASPMTGTAPVARTSLRAKVSMGSLLGAAWYVPAGRERIETAWQMTRGAMVGDTHFDFLALAYAMPVVGPFLSTAQSGDMFSRAALITSGLLQTLGLVVGIARLAGSDEAGIVETGPVISFSPIAAGHLGLSVELAGF